MRPLFTVITVVRNAVSEIEHTLNSVLCQTFLDYEYIVIDGASSDGTLDFIRKKQDRINMLISEPDTGIYNAMNKGLQYAHGNFIIFMNAGDTFATNDVLTNVANSLKRGETPVLIYGDYIRSSSFGETTVVPSRSVSKSWYGMFASHQSIFYNLDFLRQVPLLYDETYKIAADYKLTLEVVRRANPKDILQLPICISKFDLGGISNLNQNKGLMEADRARKEVLEMGWIKRIGIRLLLRIARVLRENDIFRVLYSKLRYKNELV